MSTPKHTRGPWRLGVCRPNSYKFIYGADGSAIADCDFIINASDVNLANAKLIVRAVNSHAEMLTLLERARITIQKAFDYDGDVFGIHHNQAMDDLGEIEAALAKAKGKT